jgi:DNA-binding NtrC family response regulator
VARRLKIGRSTLYRKLETMDGKQAEPADSE